MLQALTDQQNHPNIDPLGFEERLGLLVDREITERDNRRLSHRLRQARLRHNACLEDLDFTAHRGLDKALINSLRDSQWIKKHRNILITGPTGVGQSWIACALAPKAVETVIPHCINDSLGFLMRFH